MGRKKECKPSVWLINSRILECRKRFSPSILSFLHFWIRLSTFTEEETETLAAYRAKFCYVVAEGELKTVSLAEWETATTTQA